MPHMRAHMDGEEWSNWAGFFEYRDERGKQAHNQAGAVKPARPAIHRSFPRRGRRRG